MNRSLKLIVAAVIFLSLLLTFNDLVFAKSYAEVDANRVHQMMTDGNPLVIFPLSRIEFNNAHIPGSQQLPIDSLAEQLPADRERELIFYCLGVRCTASWRAAAAAAKLGYKKVYAFRGGIPEWIAAGYPTETTLALPEVSIRNVSAEKLQSMLNSGEDLVVLDTCLSVDAARFRIGSAKRLHIPFDEIDQRLDEIPRGKKIVVLCLKGKRSPTAIRYLTAKGYDDLYQLDGGMESWIMAGLPVETR